MLPLLYPLLQLSQLLSLVMSVSGSSTVLMFICERAILLGGLTKIYYGRQQSCNQSCLFQPKAQGLFPTEITKDS